MVNKLSWDVDAPIFHLKVFCPAVYQILNDNDRKASGHSEKEWLAELDGNALGLYACSVQNPSSCVQRRR